MTIYDIAKKAGVSSATVSRVLNNGTVKTATKKRVLRIIEKENFVPDNTAVYLKKPRTRKIGFIIPDILNPVYPLAVKVIHDILRDRKYQLILGNTYGEIKEERNILDMMQREKVAGIILATSEGEDDSALNPLLENFIKRNVVLVFTGKQKNGLPVDFISIDNFSGMKKATEYLLKTGNKRIGFISGDKNLWVTEKRLAGYIQALKNKNVEIDPDIIITEGQYTMECGEKWGEVLIRKKVDAVVCGNDLLAIGVIKTAGKMNIRIPEELSVTGFDDIPLASLIKHPLTTLRQPFEDASRIACERLIGRIEGRLTEKPVDILMEPELIVRESA